VTLPRTLRAAMVPLMSSPTPATPADVLTRLEAHVLTVTLQRPQKKNAFTHAMYEAAADALRRAAADGEVRVVVIEGSGGSFSAGNDLRDFLERPPQGEDSPVFQFLRALATLETPVLAAVDGPAVGIGTTMLLHCDYVAASERARFALPFVNLGLSPEGASSLLLALRAGPLVAQELLLFGEPFDAAHALRAGLVNRVLPAGELAAHVAERAATLAAKPPESVRATKRLLRAPWRAQVLETLQREGAVFLERLHSPEATEALRAFYERKP
jgi:enoyl-CoA hydratase/carnithine racemase